jgi:hypothetical protein
MPHYSQIFGGGRMTKEAWSLNWSLPQVFDSAAMVRRPNLETSIGSNVLCSFQTGELLNECQHNNWVKNPKTSYIILAFSSMKKEGKSNLEVLGRWRWSQNGGSAHLGDQPDEVGSEEVEGEEHPLV